MGQPVAGYFERVKAVLENAAECGKSLENWTQPRVRAVTHVMIKSEEDVDQQLSDGADGDSQSQQGADGHSVGHVGSRNEGETLIVVILVRS